MSRALIQLASVPPDDLAAQDRTRREAALQLTWAAKQNTDMVVFGGPDPTARADLLQLLTLAGVLGLRSGIAGGISRLGDDAFLERLVGSGLAFASLPVFGEDAVRHDALSPAADFQTTRDVLKQLQARDVEREARVILRRENLSRLAAIAESLFAYAPLRIVFAFEEAGATGSMPPLDAAARAVIAALLVLADSPMRPDGAELAFSGFPLCAIHVFPDRNADIAPWRTELLEASAAASGRIKTARCEGCAEKSRCGGVEARYLAVSGDAELRPIPTTRSNSFVYRPTGRIAPFDIERCPIQNGKIPVGNAARRLFLANGDGVDVYETDSGDFTDAEIDRVRRELGQIYLDLSGETLHTDFQVEMAKLHPHPACVACPAYINCPGVWMREPADVFALAEAKLLPWLEQLSGEILDVGGGPLRYASLFGRLLAEGRIRYTAIEPSPPALLTTFIERHASSARLLPIGIEEYPAPQARFDWALVLRSHNHFRDLDLAYATLFAALKPGGRLIAVDNTAYGMVRSAEAWDRLAKLDGAPHFEHYRNHTSEDALPYFIRAGFEPIERHPVGPRTANQWLVVLRKP